MMLSRFATETPTLCAVCRRHAVWLGYVPRNPRRLPVIWLCDDAGCHAAARKVYAMPTAFLDALELRAALEAGALAGEYLIAVGQTDVTRLDGDQWREFLRRLLAGYEHALRRKILNNELAF
jgi:hypothetical protein